MPDLGTAYVQIIPSAKGISGSISSAISGEATSAGDSAGSLLGGNLIKTLTGVVAAAGIGKTVVDSLFAGADLEQSIGGIETLFGDNAQTVLDNASTALQTAGVSMNDYMELSIQSAAAMINSLEGDQAKAAELMDMSIKDMSDNVNKMGTSMESVQMAYRGFSRGNFTMLDNLALGFAGTKEGMQELLDKAQEISGIEYDISSYSDIVEAIHVVQEEMGITGTTAQEAATTFSGSLNMLKASWQDVLAAMTTGTNLEGALAGLGASIVAFGGNVFRMLGNLFSQIPTLLSTAVTTLIPNVLSWAGEIANNLLTGLQTALPTILAAGSSLMDNIQTGITTKLPELLTKGGELISNLVSGITSALPDVISSAQDILTNVVNPLRDGATDLLAQGAELVINLISGILSSLPEIITAGGNLVSSMISGAMERLPELLNTGMSLLKQLISGILQALPDIVVAIGKVIAQIVSTVGTHLPEVLQTGIQILTQIITGILNTIPQLIAALPQVFNAIKNSFSEIDWGSIGRNIMDGIKNGISNAISSVVEAAKNAGAAIKDGVKDFFGIESPSKRMADEVGEMIPRGIALGIENDQSAIRAAEQMSDAISSASMASLNSAGSIAQGSAAGTGSMNVQITVNPSPGMDEVALAQAVGNVFRQQVIGRGTVYA